MTPHKLEACRAEIEMLLEYDMIEPSNLPWACGLVMAKKKGAAQVLLRLSLPEPSDIKSCVPDTANRREPLETWRRQVIQHTGLGFCLLAGHSAEEGQRQDLIRM